MTETILVSSCLLGLPTRYDGADNHSRAVIDYLSQNNLMPIPVCPEQLAGLPTPRLKCWFSQGDGSAVLANRGRICDEENRNLTETFLRGAKESLKIAEMTNCKRAILKQRSPSCGCRNIYQNGQIIEGMGVTAALLLQKGLQLLSEDDF